TPHYSWGVAVRETLAYVADGNSGLQIINVADPGDPQYVGSYNTPGFAADIALDDSYAYVADKDGGLHILGVGDPFSPGFVSSYQDLGSAWDVEISWPYAYVANQRAGLLILNISDPADPQFVASLDTPGLAKNVFLEDHYAFVADGDSGVVVVDVQNPAQPIAASAYYTPSHAFALNVSDGMMYVADRASLLILSFQPTVVEDQGPKTPFPQDFYLYQNCPNPFNDVTSILFSVDGHEQERELPVSLKIYNIRGQLVRTLLETRVGPGVHQASWDGKDALGRTAESGIYLCVLQAGSRQNCKKVVLLR
ncbi:T9SS type A sorting domain-containing protein, partial [bacterium]|nr:T9SS type A sorting domain-containing protein [bacterium]